MHYFFLSCTRTHRHKICFQHYLHCLPKFWIYFISDFDVLHLNLISFSCTFLLAKPNKYVGEKWIFFYNLPFSFILFYLTKLLLTMFFHFPGSRDSRGHNILNKIAKTKVFGSRMSKPSPGWRFKWEFI